IPSVAHAFGGLDDKLIATLDLQRFGLSFDAKPMPTVCLSATAGPLVLPNGYASPISGMTEEHLKNWQALLRTLSFQASVLKRFIASTPPQPGERSLQLKADGLKAALKMKRAGKDELREFLRMVLMPVADIVDEAQIDPRLAGLLSFDATLGIAVGPRSPTSILGLYYRLATETGLPRVPSGGVSAVMDAFHKAAMASGATFRFGTPVQRIMVDGGKVIGVVTASGEEIRASRILSAISPVATFGTLVGPRLLDAGFARDIRNIRTKGNVTKLNLALQKRPPFDGAGSGTTRLVYAPSVDEVERSFNPSKYGELPATPCFEAVLSADGDPSVPGGASYLSVSVQNTVYDLKIGWKKGRSALMKSVMATLQQFSPGIGETVVASEVMAPPDIEERYHVPGGHWHHGEWQVDRLFFNRPVFGAANYRAPIDGLFICGAGTHPGGGVNGLSGLNAAREMIEAGK
ncbi:MAG: NAD(P)/FAD-dependent oxidoreductase, partial [Paracoccaceae bacterium]